MEDSTMKFIDKVKTNEQTRKSLLAACGWSALLASFITVCSWISGLIGGKIGENIADLMFD